MVAGKPYRWDTWAAPRNTAGQLESSVPFRPIFFEDTVFRRPCAGTTCLVVRIQRKHRERDRSSGALKPEVGSHWGRHGSLLVAAKHYLQLRTSFSTGRLNAILLLRGCRRHKNRPTGGPADARNWGKWGETKKHDPRKNQCFSWVCGCFRQCAWDGIGPNRT